MTKRDRLDLWQERLDHARTAYQKQLEKMDHREKLYQGDGTLRVLVDGVETFERAHNVWNIIAENIESMTDSSIPQPKVTPIRKADEKLAKLIEDMIRNELDRLRCEEMNDMQERTVPIQGGGFYLLEWDNDEAHHGSVGEVAMSVLHPKQVIPQDGVTSGIEDMDYIFVCLPQTKGYIKSRYGVDVDEESEESPGMRGIDDETGTADDMVTQNIAYFRGEDGAIGLYSWCNDRELAYYEDYQARRTKRCKSCGALKPNREMLDLIRERRGAEQAEREAEARLASELWHTGESVGAYVDRPAGVLIDTEADEREDEDVCPYCGSTEWREGADDFEEIYLPIQSAHGREIPGGSWGVNEFGEPVARPTRVPVYKPDCYPVVLQRNVSLFGQLLGDSDVDKIEDQQNAMNWLTAKIEDRLLASGTMITGPSRADFHVDPKDRRVFRIDNPADKAMIDTYEFTGDISGLTAQLMQNYEAARRVLGITDSFQGRKDTTATSGKAKEFAAAQSAGRLESKRRMKDAAWAKVFEMIFKLKLAYADEARPVVSTDTRGDASYDSFDRYDFLEFDEATGEWWWNDQFLFSCDTSAPLAANREVMWQEARLNLTGGAYGDPANLETLVLFWSEMERLHYPLAGTAKAFIEEQLQRQREAEAMQAQMAMQMQAMARPTVQQVLGGTGVPAGQMIL